MIGQAVTVLTAAVVASLLAPVARALGPRVGLVDRPAGAQGLKIHEREMPVVGGFVVVAGTFLALLVLQRRPPGWLLLGVGLAFVIGLVDDLRPIPVWPRLLLLGMTGIVVAPALEVTGWGPVVAVAMAIFVVAMANAVNILDGQDGLAGGLVAVAALALASALDGDNSGKWLGLALAGGTLGFLGWNWPPARMFLGNSGAYALGTLLAVLGAALIRVRGWEGLVVAGACLSVFAFEVAATLLRRWRRGGSLTGGDRVHSYDLLARRLGSRARSTLAFILVGAAGGLLGALLGLTPFAIGGTTLLLVFGGALVGSARLWTRSQRA